MIASEDESCNNTAVENCHRDGSATAAQLPLPVPTIHVEMSELSEQYDTPSYKPEKLHRVDKQPLRTPRVAGSNMLLIQQDNSIIYGSPKPMKKRHAVVERTLSVDSCRMSANRLTCASRSPAGSSRSSRASSTEKRSLAACLSDCSRVSSGGNGTAVSDYLDDFDESSDEGYVSY